MKKKIDIGGLIKDYGLIIGMTLVTGIVGIVQKKEDNQRAEREERLIKALEEKEGES